MMKAHSDGTVDTCYSNNIAIIFTPMLVHAIISKSMHGGAHLTDL